MNAVRFGAKAYFTTEYLSTAQKQDINALRQLGATVRNRTTKDLDKQDIAVTVVDDKGNAKANEGLRKILSAYQGFCCNFDRAFEALKDAGLEKTEPIKSRDYFVYEPKDSVTPEAEQGHLKHLGDWHGLESG